MGKVLKGLGGAIVGSLIAGPIGAAVGAGAGAFSSEIGDAVGLGKKPDAPPPAPGPKVMPLADDEAVKRAKRKSIAAQVQRGGRSSTILTDGMGGGSPTLGGL